MGSHFLEQEHPNIQWAVIILLEVILNHCINEGSYHLLLKLIHTLKIVPIFLIRLNRVVNHVTQYTLQSTYLLVEVDLTSI